MITDPRTIDVGFRQGKAVLEKYNRSGQAHYSADGYENANRHPTEGTSSAPYQKQALTAVYAAYKAGKRRVIVSLPTGTGKTVVFAHFPRNS